MKEFTGKVVLITGGSSGIGLALAKQLAAKGAHVWILARNQEKLTSALEQVRSCQINSNQHSGCLQADATVQEEVSRAFADVETAVGTPDLLITSAGVCHPGYFEELPLSRFREDMDINYFGTVYAVKAVIPNMLNRRSGTIVTISSGAGFIGAFGYSAYSPAKYAVRGFTDTLRSEMKPRGIEVFIVFPPNTDTPSLAYEKTVEPFETAVEGETFAPTATPDQVAREIIKGVQKGKYTILPGFDPKLMYFLVGHLGDLVYPILDFIIKGAIKKKAKLQQSKANSPAD